MAKETVLIAMWPNGKRRITRQSAVIGEASVSNGDIEITASMNYKGMWHVTVKKELSTGYLVNFSYRNEEQRKQALELLLRSINKSDNMWAKDADQDDGDTSAVLQEDWMQMQRAMRQALLLLQGQDIENT